VLPPFLSALVDVVVSHSLAAAEVRSSLALGPLLLPASLLPLPPPSPPGLFLLIKSDVAFAAPLAALRASVPALATA